jgi:3-hydroxybutyryl-CoA dehydratase
MMPRPHERFSSTITLMPKAVSDYARAAGDLNPVHHDLEYAARTRYGRPIASGAQTTGRLIALTATHFSRTTAMVGIDFYFRFRRPVYADETIRLEWLVVSVKRHPRLKGDIVELRGRIQNASGETAVGAKGRVLVSESL